MTNAPCTELSREEEIDLMNIFPNYLDDKEEALARQFFQPLVFFRQMEDDRNQRRCVCTSCMEGFVADKRISSDFFKATHGKRCECPNCGQASTLAAMGKFKNFERLTSRERAVQLIVYEDWLLIQAGWITRTFDHEDLGGYLEFEPFRRYAFAPGRRAMWSRRTVSWLGEHGVDGPWTREDRIHEPFVCRPYEREAAYIPLNVEALSVSSLRWCQYGRWFDNEYGGVLGGFDWTEEPFRIAYLIAYLSEYTRRPQMEFLAKLGHDDVLRDLVLSRKAHRDLLNWNACTPAAFFRLSKADYRVFSDAGLGLTALNGWRAQRRRGLSFQDFLKGQKDCGQYFGHVLECLDLSHTNMNHAMRYLRQQAGGDLRSFSNAAEFWVDYLRNARQLGYDLTRADVAMPKNLRERHDLAADAVNAVKEQEQVKQYAVRYRRLTEQFEFEADGLCVVVPKGVQEIVSEGKLLQHCVGGYAKRHVSGAVTILFLRKIKNPEASYVTMELSTENNCGKLRIVQIHGFQNDKKAKEPPEVRHAGFLKLWLEWVHDGSRRDQDGQPILPGKKKECMSA